MGETSPTTDARAFAQANDEITRQQRRSRQPQEKQSQIGGSPFSAVSGNTPTVQATPPSNAPSVPNASATVTKVGQVMFSAFADELKQIIRR